MSYTDDELLVIREKADALDRLVATGALGAVDDYFHLLLSGWVNSLTEAKVEQRTSDALLFHSHVKRMRAIKAAIRIAREAVQPGELVAQHG